MGIQRVQNELARSLTLLISNANQEVLQPLAVELNVPTHTTWRQELPVLIVANGENVKVIQELMRHASSRSTLEIYSQARTADKRAAQQRVVQMIFPEDLNADHSIGEHDSEHSNVSFDWIN